MELTITDQLEIDRQIAERLGWHPAQRNGEWGWFNGDSSWSAPSHSNKNPDDVFEYLHARHGIFSYSVNMDLAMGLLYQVSDDYTPRLVRILWGAGEVLERGWKCVIMPNVGDGAEYEAIEKIPSLAICKAWLIWNEAKG